MCGLLIPYVKPTAVHTASAFRCGSTRCRLRLSSAISFADVRSLTGSWSVFSGDWSIF